VPSPGPAPSGGAERRRAAGGRWEQFTEQGYTEAHRAQSALLGGCLFEQLVGGVAAARGLSPDAVRALVDRSPVRAPRPRPALGPHDAGRRRESL